MSRVLCLPAKRTTWYLQIYIQKKRKKGNWTKNESSEENSTCKLALSVAQAKLSSSSSYFAWLAPTSGFHLCISIHINGNFLSACLSGAQQKQIAIKHFEAYLRFHFSEVLDSFLAIVLQVFVILLQTFHFLSKWTIVTLIQNLNMKTKKWPKWLKYWKINQAVIVSVKRHTSI